MPNHLLYCQNPACEKEFEAKRSDAKYCSKACKMAHSRARKKEQFDQIEARRKITSPIQEEIDMLLLMNEEINRIIEERQSKIDKVEAEPPTPKPPEKSQEQIRLEVEIEDWERAKQLSVENFYNLILNKKITRLLPYLPVGTSWIDFVLNGSHSPEIARAIQSGWESHFAPDVEISIENMVYQNRQKIPKVIQKKKEELAWMVAEQQAAETKAEPQPISDPQEYPEFKFLKDLHTLMLKKRIADNATKIIELRAKLKATPIQPPNPEPSQKPRIRRERKRKSGPSSGVAPGELRRQTFDTFNFYDQGELGRFFGNLENKMLAITLTGDPTAGKSTFSFQIVKMFMDGGFRTKYFSLEEGLGRLTMEKLDRAMIEDDDPIVLEEKGALTDIRKAAKDFDLVVIDSWGKIGAKPHEFDQLRQDFPQTVFLVIFQKTTKGEIRGGSLIIFDTPMAINIYREGKQRLAHMQKTRYGTLNWIYSITKSEVVDEGDNS